MASPFDQLDLQDFQRLIGGEFLGELLGGSKSETEFGIDPHARTAYSPASLIEMLIYCIPRLIPQ